MNRRPPLVLLIPAAVGALFLTLPVLGLLQRMPWSGLGGLLSREIVVDALGLSAVVSLSAAALAVVLGVPLAHLLAHHDFPGRSALRAIVLLPMVLPPVVGGVALLFALGRRGLVGQWLDRWFGLALPFTTAGAIVAATFVALPFLVITVDGALRSRDDGLEEAAALLGAGPLTRFFRITLPAIRPALIGGIALAWARALGEFGATITFAGNFPGRTQTLPLATFLALEQDPEAALALSLVLLVISFTVLVSLRDRWYPR